VAEPVIAERGSARRGPKRGRRNDWHRSRGLRASCVADSPLHVPPGARESRAPRSTRRRAPAMADAGDTRDGWRASAGRFTGKGWPILFQRCPAPARAIRRARSGATAGVRSLRMCRRGFEHARAHSQGGHPRGARLGEACHSHQEGRRDARRWPKALEDDECHTPPQGGEPELRRDERRTRRQAGEAENPVLRNGLVRVRHRVRDR
jgi:hypothetical protein